MKTSFSFFKNKGLTYLAIALCIVSLPLYANDCGCGNNNACHCAQISQDENETSETENLVEKAEEKESVLRQCFSDPINLYQGPLWMVGSPFASFLMIAIANELGNESFWKSVYNYSVIFPCLTISFFTYGTLKTVTFGKFSGSDTLLKPFDFIIRR